jgi:hypothetical protein
MKPFVLAISAACLALAVAACGGAKSATPAPSVNVEAAAPSTSSTNTTEEPADYLQNSWDQTVEYFARADAICKAATDQLEAALPELEGMALDDVEFRITRKALAELRALPPPDVSAVNPVALCSHRGGTQQSADPPTRAEYIAQANAICRAAAGRLPFINLTPPEQALEVARIEEEALAELRALPQPEADRALLEEAFYSVVEQEIAVLREYAAASSAGATARALLVGMERVHLTHQRGGFTSGYGLGSCPVDLPA